MRVPKGGLCLVFSSAVLLLGSLWMTPVAQAAPGILITAFEPFAGNPRNLSMPVAESVTTTLESLYPELEIGSCVLPVVYDRAADALFECAAKLREWPETILSFGEGSCVIRLETRARNRDQTPTLPDNSGEIRADRPILEGGVEYMSLMLPVARMRASLPESERDRVVISDDMGGFVCNNIAYLALDRLRDSSTRYGFIHIPPESCGEMSEPADTARVVSDMLPELFQQADLAIKMAYSRRSGAWNVLR